MQLLALPVGSAHHGEADSPTYCPHLRHLEHELDERCCRPCGPSASRSDAKL